MSFRQVQKRKTKKYCKNSRNNNFKKRNNSKKENMNKFFKRKQPLKSLRKNNSSSGVKPFK
jgi:hypothetical protein